MDSLFTFNACLHPAPIKCGSYSTRGFLSTINSHSRRCLNFSEGPNSLRAGLVRQLQISGFEDRSRKRSVSQGIRASDAAHSETVQGGDKENEKIARQTEENEAVKGIEEGGAIGKCWVLRSASKDKESQEIAHGDGIVVGAAPNVTGSAKPFVVDFPMVSSSHARVYSKERKSYQDTVRDYFVMDLGSTNGTFLNRSKLRPQTEVKISNGDTLKFGDERATFIVEAQN